MDIVLEVFDTFIGDHVYSALVPVKPAPYDVAYDGSSNATIPQTFSSWQYEPATHFFTLEPSQAAYTSAWDRDNIFRQAITLFTITWYV